MIVEAILVSQNRREQTRLTIATALASGGVDIAQGFIGGIFASGVPVAEQGVVRERAHMIFPVRRVHGR